MVPVKLRVSLFRLSFRAAMRREVMELILTSWCFASRCIRTSAAGIDGHSCYTGGLGRTTRQARVSHRCP
jgi:hypothetical protein